MKLFLSSRKDRQRSHKDDSIWISFWVEISLPINILSGKVETLSDDLANLNDVVKEKHSELAKHVDNKISTITKTAEKDRNSFYNRFEEVADTIQSVEAKIVKEEDLTELFQNYTLNVNISDEVKPSKS